MLHVWDPVFSSTAVCTSALSWGVPSNQKLAHILASLSGQGAPTLPYPLNFGVTGTLNYAWLFYIGIQLGTQTQILVLAE